MLGKLNKIWFTSEKCATKQRSTIIEILECANCYMWLLSETDVVAQKKGKRREGGNNINKIKTYILIVYLTIHYNEFLSNENLWCASFYYDEIMHYKIHKKKID